MNIENCETWKKTFFKGPVIEKSWKDVSLNCNKWLLKFEICTITLNCLSSYTHPYLYFGWSLAWFRKYQYLSTLSIAETIRWLDCSNLFLDLVLSPVFYFANISQAYLQAAQPLLNLFKRFFSESLTPNFMKQKIFIWMDLLEELDLNPWPPDSWDKHFTTAVNIERRTKLNSNWATDKLGQDHFSALPGNKWKIQIFKVNHRQVLPLLAMTSTKETWITSIKSWIY